MMMGGHIGGHGGGNTGGGHDAAREARHKLRDEQLKMAMEVNPEAFVHVPMLYVMCELNNTPVKAFVDTGAQMTVMTAKCAQRCNLLPAVDPRFKGVAAGVGVARIAGRVHMATLRLSRRTAVDTSITVLEQGGGPELLLGLDLMRKVRAPSARALSLTHTHARGYLQHSLSRDRALHLPHSHTVPLLPSQYQATIDLARNALVIGGEAFPFVPGDEKHR